MNLGFAKSFLYTICPNVHGTIYLISSSFLAPPHLNKKEIDL